ncbi:MAG: aminotransferase class V-fold PLP-dependent enzyme [Rhodanobacter sp.]|nr:MAG: aminotransferase class V-fold PLP-dependent enzyme [Rhodanobacter sp.]
MQGLPAGSEGRIQARENGRWAASPAGSNYNTPPVFSIYVLNLVSRWLRDEIGGVDAMEKINLGKAAMLYQALERHPEVIEIHADARR